MTTEMDKFYTLTEVAGILRVHYNTVYRLVTNGKLSAFHSGHIWRVSGADLVSYLKRGHKRND